MRTAAEIDQLVSNDFDDEQHIAEQIEELTSRPNTAALQRPCTASIPSRITQQPSVLACLAHITTQDNESEESFYARIIQTARQQQQQQAPGNQRKAEKRISVTKQRRESGRQSTGQHQADTSPPDQKRDSVADIYVVPSRTHSPPLGSSRPSTSSSASSTVHSSASCYSFTSTSSTSATPRSQLFDGAYDDTDRLRATAGNVQSTVSFGQLSAPERDVRYVEQSQVSSASTASDRPFSRRTSIRSRFPAIGK